jgi:hypothetical protein
MSPGSLINVKTLQKGYFNPLPESMGDRFIAINLLFRTYFRLSIPFLLW